MTLSLLALLWGCSSPPTYIVQGVVVEVGPSELVVDHRPIEGFVGAMTSPFPVEDAALLATVEPGDRVLGRIAVRGTRVTLEKLRVTGSGPVPLAAERPPLKRGELLVATSVELHTGARAVVGAGQGVPTVLTFLYSRCPDANFCPATLARLRALAGELDGVRLVGLTLDPAHDTVAVLAELAASHGADGERFAFARADAAATRELAVRASLPVARSASGEIVHELRWLVLGADGRLVARFDDNDLTAEAVRAALDG